MDWNNDKQLKLENYVKSIASETSNVDELFERVDWPYLITYLNIRNHQFIQMKVDEIYEEQYSIKVNDNGINTIIEEWRNKDSEIYREVSQIVENLNLQEFKVHDENGSKERADEIIHSEENQLDQVDDYVGEDNTVQNLPSLQEVSTENRQPLASHKVDLPKLTNTQRRMSLDLMHTIPMISSGTQMPELTKKKPNLSKPAPTTTTNVNVTTKTDINTNANKKGTALSNRSRFQDFLRKIKLKITRNTSDAASPPKSPLIVQLDDTLKGKSENLMDPQDKQIKSKNRYNPSELKKSRRLSLVGENLPLYIRQQLDANHSIQSPILRNSSYEADSASSTSLSKPQSRMHNLLENSQSLYSQSKDLSLIGSGSNQDYDTMPNTSEIERINEHNDETENGSDDDKEYILPDLLARYYGNEANQDDLITNINEIEDAFDFINVRSYDAYDEGEEAGGEDEEEEDEEYNEDDEYLFKI